MVDRTSKIGTLATIGRNAWLLVVAQGLGMTSLNINVIIVGLSGLLIAPQPWLATLPLSMQFISSMLSTLPASLIMGKIGRKPVFLFGIAAMAAGMIGQGYALINHNFTAFCIAALFVGSAHGIGQFYRYAAADSVPEKQKSVALSLVLGGGLIAAFAGATIVKNTIYLYPEMIYVGCFFAAAAMQIISASIIIALKIPKSEKITTSQRSIKSFFKKPRFIAGVIAAALGYAIMSFMMTATPLQIVSISKLGDGANATIIQWHVVAMFAPSFFTGGLIKRYGVEAVMAVGLILYGAAIIIALNGDSFWHYLITLAFIGGGWNALYIGGSSIIAVIAQPSERPKIQGISDFLITSCIVIASLSAGAVHYLVGWEVMAKLLVIPIGIIAGAIGFMMLDERRKKAKN